MDIEECVEIKEAQWIDVRSPLEYAEGHFQLAENIFLFSDETRALVGTVYKQKGRQEAIERALSLVDFSEIAFRLRKFSLEKPLVIYCARGGMRSQGVGFLAELLGYNKVFLVSGGYKSIRKWNRDQFEKKYKLKILGGRTGVGKTHYLSLLQGIGENVIDLEALASHKGSVFGGIGKVQPTQEHFENLLAYALFTKQRGDCIWVEDESRFIGKVTIPETFFCRMRESSLWVLETLMEARIQRICDDYASEEKNELTKAIEKLRKRLGSVSTGQALLCLEQNDYKKCCEILFSHYDKRYDYDLSKRESFFINKLEIQGKREEEVLRELVEKK
ncbi:MAG: tRNA 2-selenouridine(34) synthase MnmH [Chlamydiota bacterium]